MENSGAISPIDRRMARAQETALARFYGLPKVHKEGAPLRPIVSLKGTPTYGLAKWLFQRLKFLTSDSNSTVSSSTQFLEKLKGVSLLPSDIMVSFDVTSLFTSIPQDLAVETIELLLREKYDETENRLGHAQIIQLLKFCLKTYFTFDGTIYEQVKGTPMGSPISGLIAEAVLQRLESLVFRHHRPKFWARYVDDTFVVIERDQVLTFKEQINAIFPDIQFAMEEEENNQLAFLDVLVCRKDCGGLKTKVFRKATNTTQILNFNSNHLISHKRSCVRALYRRVETHCSEMEDKVAELQYLRRNVAEDRPARRAVKTEAAIYEANRIAVVKAKRAAYKPHERRKLKSSTTPLRKCLRCQPTFCRDISLVGHLRIQWHKNRTTPNVTSENASTVNLTTTPTMRTTTDAQASKGPANAADRQRGHNPATTAAVVPTCTPGDNLPPHPANHHRCGFEDDLTSSRPQIHITHRPSQCYDPAWYLKAGGAYTHPTLVPNTNAAEKENATGHENVY
ncbi:hypothetical protein SprV_0200562800 [Sparganum proliferum]